MPERLRHAIRDGRMFHAYLFEGGREDTASMADEFAAAALCGRQDGSVCGSCVSCRQIRDGISPYIFRVRTLDEPVLELGEEPRSGKKTKSKDTGKIKDKQIEDVLARSRGGSLSGSRAITIIERADTITPRGQNRLLKILEEPPEDMMIILLTDNAEGLLETIRSRCQIARPLEKDADGMDVRDAFTGRAVTAAANILTGMPAVDLWKEIDYFADSREKALRFTEIAMLFFRDVTLYGQPGCQGLIALRSYEEEIRDAADKSDRDTAVRAAGACERAIRDLKALVSGRHALRYMMFDIQLLHGVNNR